MDSERVIHDELSQYKVVEHLESIDPNEYHAFLYHLLNHFKGASVALEFLFNEILRYEPSASPLIQKLQQILMTLSNLGFMRYWSEFITFSSQPPFAIDLDEQRFTDFLRQEITESSLAKLCSVCSLLSIPESTAYHCFVVKTLFDSQSKPSRFFAFSLIVAFNWNLAVSSVSDYLPLLPLSDLLSLVDRCLFSSECASIMQPSFLSSRRLLVDAALAALTNADDNKDAAELYSHLQGCQNVTDQLQTNFFELHVRQPLEQIVLEAYESGLDIAVIQSAISILEPVYHVDKHDILLSLVEEVLKEILEFQKKERIAVFMELFQKIVENWRISNKNAVSLLLQRILDLFVEFQKSAISLPMAKLLLYLVKVMELRSTPFIPEITGFILHSLFPSRSLFPEFQKYSTFSDLTSIFLPLIPTLDTADSIAIAEVLLESIAPPSLYSSALSISQQNVLNWIDGDGGLMSFAFRSSCYDLLTLTLVRTVSEEPWKWPLVQLRKHRIDELCFDVVSHCFQAKQFDAAVCFALYPAFVAISLGFDVETHRVAGERASAARFTLSRAETRLSGAFVQAKTLLHIHFAGPNQSAYHRFVFAARK